MKNKIFIALTIIVLAAIIIVAFILPQDGNSNNSKTTKKEEVTDNIKFKEEYESLNGKLNDKNKEYVRVDIDEDNHMKYASFNEIVNILESGTGIIYFGFPECPWCRNAVPVLIDAANELGIDEINYFNALDMRDTRTLDDEGNIVVEKESTKEYQKLVELMYDELPVYEGLNDDTIKRIYFPTVVFVKDGEIVGLHVSTLDSQEDPYVKLSDDEYNELKQIYMDGINDAYDILCDEAC